MVPTDAPPLIGRRRTHDGRPATEAPPATDDAPSKTRRKAESQARQDLGVLLVELDTGRFELIAAEAALPERLVEAIVAARNITAWGGRKRQMQFIGKLMRDVEAEPIAAQLAAIKGESAPAKAEFHALERWRERLLEDDAALSEWLALHPGADLQQMRQLIRNAHKEAAESKPPKSSRQLFRLLRDTTP